ncbi:MAG: DUF5989 family protein [Candidatus Poribacteria bacterium]
MVACDEAVPAEKGLFHNLWADAQGGVSIFETIRELLALMWSSGQWWLIPLVILLLVCAVIIVIGSASGVGPLIYTLF